ncbi:MAG TPA: polymer-forming cytoskeletal protein [Candidatus Methylomirabilis sp.]|nr:polymer-forming cytoskeletal protein [Candidatus Methylomirabilis sp.]
MAFFTPQPRKDEPVAKPETKPEPKPEPKVESPREQVAPPPPTPTRRMEEPVMSAIQPKGSESLVAKGLTIEGKIEGSGDVRIAGRFKGTINVKGEFRIEPGATIEGEVSADTVLVGGEVNGKIVASSRVEFKESGSLIGDLKAGSLTVAAGSKMRGNVEFGWKEGEVESLPLKERGHAAIR